MVDFPYFGAISIWQDANHTHKNSLPYGESEGELYTKIVGYTALLSLRRSIGTCR